MPAVRHTAVQLLPFTSTEITTNLPNLGNSVLGIQSTIYSLFIIVVIYGVLCSVYVCAREQHDSWKG